LLNVNIYCCFTEKYFSHLKLITLCQPNEKFSRFRPNVTKAAVL
jgi:hypothetical protein